MKILLAVLCILVVVVTGCSFDAATNNPPYVPNVYQSSNLYAGYCASPRTGINPATGNPYPDRQGSSVWENFWLRSWTNESYLWYDEVADVNPYGYTTPAYFDLMKTMQTTTSGQPKDRFHFTYDTSTWYQISQAGSPVGYGILWAFVAAAPPRQVLVAYSQPNAPTPLVRGAEILSIDGVDMVNGSNVATLNEGLYPTNAGEAHVFVIRDTPLATPHTVTLTSAAVVSQPAPVVATLSEPGGTVGYVLFNDQEANSESAMIAAINTLVGDGVTDIVLDLRYNSGGYLAVASEVSYMIAGATQTAGKIFELQQYNNKLGAATPLLFLNKTVGFNNGPPAGEPLPTLNLNRVYVLTTDATCSASESIINGLRGIGVTVIQIGSTTCGKPYGFFPTDNCGTTYFSIQFKGVNDVGFGDYSDGFKPVNSAEPASVSLPGCFVADDFTHALGDKSEALFAAALQYRVDGTCPPVLFRTMKAPAQDKRALRRPAWMTNKILR